MLSQIDLVLGAGTATLLVLLAALLFRDFRAVAAGRLATAFALGSAAHAVTASSGFAPPVTPWHAVLIAVSTGNVVVFWLFARALFDDGFKVRRWHAAPWATVVVLSLINCLVLVPAQTLDPHIFAIAISVISLVFVALAVGQTIASWSTDLVEERRRLRIFVVVATAIYAVVNAILQLLMPANGSSGVLATANAAILAGVVIAIAYSLMRVGGETIFPAAEAQPTAAAAFGESGASDRKLLNALMRLIRWSHLRDHQAPGAVLGDDKPDPSPFLAWAEAPTSLAARAAVAVVAKVVPVITIAMDAGFQSLGPFNRAFKATTGVTPTEYRRLNEARV